MSSTRRSSKSTSSSPSGTRDGSASPTWSTFTTRSGRGSAQPRFASSTESLTNFAVSEYVRQTAMLRGSTPESVSTILNPVPFTHVNVEGVDRERVRASLGIPSGAPLVVAAGRLDPGKGHVALLDAFKLVLERMPEARLLICGNPDSKEYGNALRKRSEDLGVDRSTIFAGWRGDMPQIYRAADVFCLPSEMDPCALVYLEAMGAGLPVVALYSGGTPELVEHERTGLLAYPKDTAALAGHLTRLLRDPALARDFGAAGRKRARSTTSIVALSRSDGPISWPTSPRNAQSHRPRRPPRPQGATEQPPAAPDLTPGYIPKWGGYRSYWTNRPV